MFLQWQQLIMVVGLDVRLTMRKWSCFTVHHEFLHMLKVIVLQLSIISLISLGPPSPVADLTAIHQDQCSILVKWNPPYLLPGLSVSYTVSINGNMQEEDIPTTNYTYYPMKLASATYELAVSAFNDSVVGDASITTASFTIGMLLVCHTTLSATMEWCPYIIPATVPYKIMPTNCMFILVIMPLVNHNREIIRCITARDWAIQCIVAIANATVKIINHNNCILPIWGGAQKFLAYSP